MFSGADAPWHWLILGIVVIALFGYKKLPDAARSLGRSMRIFKTEIKGMTEDDSAREAAKTPPPLAQTRPISETNLTKAAPVADAAPVAEATVLPPVVPMTQPTSQPTTPGTV